MTDIHGSNGRTFSVPYRVLWSLITVPIYAAIVRSIDFTELLSNESLRLWGWTMITQMDWWTDALYRDFEVSKLASSSPQSKSSPEPKKLSHSWPLSVLHSVPHFMQAFGGAGPLPTFKDFHHLKWICTWHGHGGGMCNGTFFYVPLSIHPLMEYVAMLLCLAH